MPPALGMADLSKMMGCHWDFIVPSRAEAGASPRASISLVGTVLLLS